MDGGRSQLEQVAARIRNARRLTVLTGAGVSAASGVPTFREAQGLWNDLRPEDLATPEAFARDPQLVWTWYAWRRSQVAACAPNPAHEVLARWSRSLACRVITQNVDDLHLKSGTRGLLRLHGSLWEISCSARCTHGRHPWRDDDVTSSALRRCPHCDAIARPAVVWFGESLDQAVLAEATRAASCDVFMTVGTSSVVYPAAGLVQYAARADAFTVEINVEATPASDVVHVAIAEAAETVLPALDGLLAPPDCR
jgi:NAD-dependent deacetylase